MCLIIDFESAKQRVLARRLNKKPETAESFLARKNRENDERVRRERETANINLLNRLGLRKRMAPPLPPTSNNL